jgi:hypothetical protein
MISLYPKSENRAREKTALMGLFSAKFKNPVSAAFNPAFSG